MTSPTPVMVTGGQIAADALAYVGSGYVYGGVPGSGRGIWDCSSFVNACIGRDFGLAIPGFGAGSYHGQVHGPDVDAWASWSGVTSVSTPQTGDLACWPGAGTAGHIGIALDATTMVSALNSSLGTLKSPIAGYGPSGVQVVFRRLTGTAAGGATGTTGPRSGCAWPAAAAVLSVLAPAGWLAVHLASHVRI